MNRTATCFFCGQVIVDGRDESGFTGIGPDWCTEDGDYGCDKHPGSDEEGVCGHRTKAEVLEIVRAVEIDGPLAVTEEMRVKLYGADQD